MQQQGKHTLPCSAHSFRLGWCLRALGNFAHHLWMIQQGSPWSSQKNVIGFKEKKNAQAETLPFNFLSFLFNWSEILLSSPVWCSCFQWNFQKQVKKYGQLHPATTTSFPFARSSLRSELTSWGNKATKRFTGVKRKFLRLPWGPSEVLQKSHGKSGKKTWKIQLSSRSFCSFLRLEWREALPPAGWTSGQGTLVDYIWQWFYM